MAYFDKPWSLNMIIVYTIVHIYLLSSHLNKDILPYAGELTTRPKFKSIIIIYLKTNKRKTKLKAKQVKKKKNISK